MKNIFIILSLLMPCLVHAQVIKTIAGTGTLGYTGNGELATTADLNDPWVARLHAGSLYIADGENNYIREISSSGIITTIAGNGSYGSSGDGGQATNAKLTDPSDVAFDAEGNLYISDGNAIRKVTTAGIITTIAGTGVTGLSGADGPATSVQLYDALGLQFDTAGNLYFSDNSTYRIRKINTHGIISTIAGTGISGYSGDNGPATAAQINYVGYLGMDHQGNLYLPDYGQRVRMINAVTGIITTVAGNGTNSYAGDGLQATAASLMSPFAVTFDQADNMYISDNGAFVVRKVDIFGIITTVAGDGTHGFSGDDGPATNAQFEGFLNCSAVDAGGNLYIADPENNRIREVIYNTESVKNTQSLQNNISIYPNPASNEITIKAGDKIGNVEVVNMVGQITVEQTYGNSKKVSIDMGDLPPGVYFVKVNGVYAGKFVKE